MRALFVIYFINLIDCTDKSLIAKLEKCRIFRERNNDIFEYIWSESWKLSVHVNLASSYKYLWRSEAARDPQLCVNNKYSECRMVATMRRQKLWKWGVSWCHYTMLAPHSPQTQTRRINTSSTIARTSQGCYKVSHLILDPTTLPISPLNCTNKTYGKPGLRWGRTRTNHKNCSLILDLVASLHSWSQVIMFQHFEENMSTFLDHLPKIKF